MKRTVQIAVLSGGQGFLNRSTSIAAAIMKTTSSRTTSRGIQINLDHLRCWWTNLILTMLRWRTFRFNFILATRIGCEQNGPKSKLNSWKCPLGAQKSEHGWQQKYVLTLTRWRHTWSRWWKQLLKELYQEFEGFGRYLKILLAKKNARVCLRCFEMVWKASSSQCCDLWLAIACLKCTKKCLQL
jgi:hypothetical protein